MRSKSVPGFLLAGAFALCVAATPAAWGAFGDEDGTPNGGQPGVNNAITDVPGILVGQYQQIGDGYLTGTTVIYAPNRAVAGVDVSGGAPGTRETDLLDPRNRVQRVDAIMLSGGSSFGLRAAAGVMRWLQENDHGFKVGQEPGQVVPIVPGAIIFDLNRGGKFTATPTPEFGYKAIAAAHDGAVKQGTVGAGTGAHSGSLKGGVGTASIVLPNGYTVGALVVVNSYGSTVDPATCHFYAADLELGDEFGLTDGAVEACHQDGDAAAEDAPESMNTTIAVVATDAPLTKAQASKMAGMAQDGMARAIRPIHTLYDGDSVFVMSTGEGPAWTVNGHVGDLNKIFAAGANTLSRAIVKAVRNAESAQGMKSYCDQYPSACAAE